MNVFNDTIRYNIYNLKNQTKRKCLYIITSSTHVNPSRNIFLVAEIRYKGRWPLEEL